MRLSIFIKGCVRPSVYPSVRLLVRSSVCPLLFSNEIIINDTTSDDEVVTPGVPAVLVTLIVPLYYYTFCVNSD